MVDPVILAKTVFLNDEQSAQRAAAWFVGITSAKRGSQASLLRVDVGNAHIFFMYPVATNVSSR